MTRRITVAGLVALASVLGACGDTMNPGNTEDREKLHSQALAALADFKKADPTLDPLINSANAYAIFPDIVTGAVVVGGAHGKGEVYKGGKLIGYADMSQASIGAQLGGQSYSELILFQNDTSLAKFTGGTWEFDASATAVAASEGAGKKADYAKGVMVFYYSQSGLMASAAIGGQKFRYTPVNP